MGESGSAREPDSRDFDDYARAATNRLLKLAYLLTGNVHDAEDLLQESLARLFLSWERVSRAVNWDAYTRQILVNANRRRFRRRRPSEILQAVPPDGGTQLGEFSVVEDRRDLAGALRKLPRGQRAVVILRYYEDLSEREVAELLGCSVGTVKSQASKALARLRGTTGFVCDRPAARAHPGSPT